MANRVSTNGLVINVGMNLNDAQANAQFTNIMGKFQEKAVIQAQVKINNDVLTKSIKRYKDDMGNLITETNVFSRSWGNVQREITSIKTPLEQVNEALARQAKYGQQVRGVHQKLNTQVRNSTSVFRDFTATFSKMIKFNTINMIYDGIIRKISEAIQITNDFNKATTELKKVSDLTGESLKEYAQELSAYGESVGRTMTEMVESATIFKRTGATDEEALHLAQIAELYKNVADSEISSSEASSFLVSQMKAFNMTADESIRVIDAVNEVAANYAVSTDDLQTALVKSSAALATAGNSYEETIALIEAGTAVMQGQAGIVGNGLRTIAINVAKLATSTDEWVAANGKVKISLKDSNGEIRNTYEILNDLSQYWDDLSRAEQNEIATSLAGKTRYNVLTSVMRNFTDAQNSLNTALTSSGSAWKQNEAYMESIAAHQAKLKAEWEKLVLSAPIEDLEKSLLNAGAALLKFANSDVGQTIIKVTAFVVVTGLLTKNIIKLPYAINAWVISQYGLNASLTAGTVIMDLFTKAVLANPIFWGAAAVAGIVAVITLLDKLIVSFEEQIEVLEDLNDQYKQTQSECDGLVRQIEEIEEAINNINEKKLSLTDEEDIKALNQESKELQQQEALLKAQLALKEAQLKADKEKAKEQAHVTQWTTVEYVGHNENPNSYNYGGEERKRGFIGEALQEDIYNVELYKQKLEAAEKELNNYTIEEIQSNEALAEKSKELTELRTKYLDAQDSMNTHAQQILEIKEAGEELNEANQRGYNAWEKYVGIQNEVSNSVENNKKSLQEQIEELQESDELASDITDEYELIIKPLSDIESNYSLLNKAMKEFNEKGGITASTAKKLAELDRQWYAALVLKDGQLTVDNDLVQKLAKSEQDKAVSTLQAQAAQDMMNAAIGDFNSLSPIAQSAIQELAKANKIDAENATEAAEAELLLAAAIDAKNTARYGTSYGEYSDRIDAIEAIQSKYAQVIENMKAWNLDFGDTSSSTAGSSKDAWVEAFEEEQRLLKHALEMNEITEIEYYEKLTELNEKYFGEISGNHKKYLKEYQENEEEIYKGMKSIYEKVADYLKEAIEQGYEDAINVLKKEEKRVLDEIKAQIDALKKEKQYVIDEIQDQIDGLKKKKDKVLDYWNSQIDAIKEANETLQEQNELLEKQQALQQAKAQKVMVMQNGKFQLSENESAVAQAEQNLAQYEDQLSYEQQIEEMEKIRDAQIETIEDRIENLEEYKDYMEDYYDSQIEALEEYRDQVEREYEAQIDALQEQLDVFKRGAEQQKKIEEARLAARVLGINQEAELFQISLENAQKYVDAYNTIMESLGHSGKGASVDVEFIKATTSGIPTDFNFESIKAHSSGTAFVGANEVALVGESPNTELVLGSNVNRSLGGGTLMNLRQGSGVVNAESTATLAGLLNGITRPNQVANHNKSMQQNFTFGNITLPNVTDADSFVNTLSTKFNTYSIQYGNNRR